jgi:hypothetical protein
MVMAARKTFDLAKLGIEQAIDEIRAIGSREIKVLDSIATQIPSGPPPVAAGGRNEVQALRSAARASIANVISAAYTQLKGLEKRIAVMDS